MKGMEILISGELPSSTLGVLVSFGQNGYRLATVWAGRRGRRESSWQCQDRSWLQRGHGRGPGVAYPQMLASREERNRCLALTSFTGADTPGMRKVCWPPACA